MKLDLLILIFLLDIVQKQTNQQNRYLKITNMTSLQSSVFLARRTFTFIEFWVLLFLRQTITFYPLYWKKLTLRILLWSPCGHLSPILKMRTCVFQLFWSSSHFCLCTVLPSSLCPVFYRCHSRRRHILYAMLGALCMYSWELL